MKKIKWVILIVLFVTINTIITVKSFQKLEQKNIPDNYIAVFKGESSEVVYSTYLYEKKKGKKKTYKYINTTSTLEGYDSTNWTEEVTKKGKIKKINKIFEIASNNGAYSYVKYKDDQIYSIEEFENIINK